MTRFSYHPTIEPLEVRTLLATCHVTRLGDFGAGGGFQGDLRYCINKVNAEPGPDTIDLTVQGAIKLTAALPDLSSDVSIQGPGADLLTVRRDTGGYYRIFTIPAGATVQITGITISNGLQILGAGGIGGGIWNDGSLTLQAAVVSGNTAADGNGGGALGGGIYNTGDLTLIASRIERNVALSNPDLFRGGAVGGGIYNVRGTVTAIGSTISHNRAHIDFTAHEDGDAVGGGIANYLGTVSLDRSTLSSNRASGGWNSAFGGGAWNYGGTLTITSSTLTGNRVRAPLGGDGGGILSDQVGASVVIRHSTITDNIAAEIWGEPYYGAGMKWSGGMDVKTASSRAIPARCYQER
jgi:hypothetical protein